MPQYAPLLKVAAIAASLTVAAGSTAATAQTATATEVTVAANQAWQTVHPSVEGGCTLQYQYGAWTTNPRVGLFHADGNKSHIAKPGYPLPGAPEGMLVAQVGSTVLGAGLATVIPAGVSGPLALMINDDYRGIYGTGLADNIGSVTISITCPR
ncbi:hypothetical protein ACM64Y_12835 [Novispirillum sp. DQ9]|uniref:hypothetical protein n=1 Tax=Novispirillum sp. DQ9 TaxID=3398612 RepID=UPI003C7B0C15